MMLKSDFKYNNIAQMLKIALGVTNRMCTENAKTGMEENTKVRVTR